MAAVPSFHSSNMATYRDVTRKLSITRTSHETYEESNEPITIRLQILSNQFQTQENPALLFIGFLSFEKEARILVIIDRRRAKGKKRKLLSSKVRGQEEKFVPRSRQRREKKSHTLAKKSCSSNERI